MKDEFLIDHSHASTTTPTDDVHGLGEQQNPQNTRCQREGVIVRWENRIIGS